MASSGPQRFNSYLNALQEEFTVQSNNASTNSSRARQFNIYLGGLKGEYELIALEVESLRKEIEVQKAKIQMQEKELQDICRSVGCEKCRKRITSASGNLTSAPVKTLKIPSASFSRTINNSKYLDKKPSTSDVLRDVNLRQEMTTRPLIRRTAQTFDPESGSEEHGWSAFNQELDMTMAREFFHGMAIWYVKFSQDGKYLAAGCRNGKAYIYDVGTGALKRVLRNLLSKRDSITAVCFSCDRKYLATGLGNGSIYIWEVNTKYIRNAFKGHTNTIVSLHFSPKGRLLSASRDNTVRLWNMRDGAAKLLIEDIPISLDNPYYSSAVFSPDGRLVAASHRDGMVRIWDTRIGQLIRIKADMIGSVEDVMFMPDGTGLLSGSQTLKYWDVGNLGGNQFCASSQSDPRKENTGMEEQMHPEQEFFGHECYVRRLGISPDGRWFASCSDDRTVRIWNTRDATTQCILKQKHRVWTIDFSPAGQYLASGGFDGMVRIWRYSSTTVEC